MRIQNRLNQRSRFAGRVVVALLIGWGAITASFAQTETTSVQATIQKRLDSFAKAIVRHDETAIKRMIPERFTFFAEDMTLSREDYIKGILEAREREHDLTIQIKLKKLKVRNDGALGFGTAFTSGTIYDANQKPVRVDVEEYLAMKWSRDGSDYLLESVERLSAKIKINGKLREPGSAAK
jgi:ketosteroid isomerase-like protein